MPPFRLLCCFLFSSFDRPKRGQRLRLGRARKAFHSLVSLALVREASKRTKPVLAPSYTCKGGQVGAYGTFCISLVSFFVIASFKFQARKHAFALWLWLPPNGGGALLWANAQPTHLRPSGFALRPKLLSPHIRNGLNSTTTIIKYHFKLHLKRYFFFTNTPILLRNNSILTPKKLRKTCIIIIILYICT